MIKITTIKNTCNACPSQWEAIDAESRPVYIRYRWGCLSIRVGEQGQDISDAIRSKPIFEEQLEDNLGGVLSYEDLKIATVGVMELP